MTNRVYSLRAAVRGMNFTSTSCPAVSAIALHAACTPHEEMSTPDCSNLKRMGLSPAPLAPPSRCLLPAHIRKEGRCTSEPQRFCSRKESTPPPHQLPRRLRHGAACRLHMLRKTWQYLNVQS